MILEILGVADQSDKTKQRLRLKVTDDGNLNAYAIVDNTFKDGGIPSNVHRHFFSFPNYNVKKGDYVWLYSTTGTQTKLTNEGKTITHVFYWNLDISVWNAKDTAHLLKIVQSKDIVVETK